MSSGVPFAEVPGFAAAYSRCMSCAGTDTLCVYASTQTIDCADFQSCEYVCSECGKFTSWDSSNKH